MKNIIGHCQVCENVFILCIIREYYIRLLTMSVENSIFFENTFHLCEIIIKFSRILLNYFQSLLKSYWISIKICEIHYGLLIKFVKFDQLWLKICDKSSIIDFNFTNSEDLFCCSWLRIVKMPSGCFSIENLISDCGIDPVNERYLLRRIIADGSRLFRILIRHCIEMF